MDITPSKIDVTEKKEFHKILKNMCNRHNKNYYGKYKKWCDEYFYLPHRKEPRGIGGIFFDYKNNNFEKNFKFVRDVGVTFQLIFNKIISKKINKKWTSKDKEMQYIKRGRYAEFNLLYDRGTKFGLLYGSANRDPDQFPDADTFDITRNPNRHVAFGRGAHLCLGNHLSRLDMEVIFLTILRRTRHIELTDPEPAYKKSLSVRGPESLHVTLTPK